MNIAFFGASKLGFECCEALLENGFSIKVIYTIAETFSIKYKEERDRLQVRNSLFADFTLLGNKYKVDVIVLENGINGLKEDFAKRTIDFGLVIGWYYMIPKEIINSCSKGFAGIHGSLLPKYRGNAPFVWAMINGERKTGISFFYFDDGVDTGDIIFQKEILIEENDTIKNVLEKAEIESRRMLLDQIPKIADGTSTRIKQDHSLATYFPKRTPNDGLINWAWNSLQIKNFIRAQTKPYPGAYTIIDNKKITIWDADIQEEL